MPNSAASHRILVLASTYPRWPGDHEPGFVHELSRRIAHDFDVHVLCPHAPGTPLYEIMDGVHVHRFRYAPASLETLVSGGGILNNIKHQKWKWLLVPFFLIGLTWANLLLIRKLKPDCLHVHWIIPQGVASLLARLVLKQPPPVLITSHGGDLFSLRGTLLARLKHIVIRHAAMISVVSKPMAKLAIELGATQDRLRVIPMGVDFHGLFTPGQEINRTPNEILFVGRLVEKKGLKFLLKAMPLILASMPKVRLTVAGYGPEEKHLRELANELGIAENVTFLGATPQRDLPSLYQRASLFVAPFIRADSGDQEGLPVALMESIACECPVLAGNLEVMDDIFENSEKQLMLVDSTNVAAMAERIIDVLNQADEAQYRARLLRTRLSASLDWGNIADQYTSVLKSIILTPPKIRLA
jgi:glycosyltransferase involved in cell wall biosynthesis